MIHRPHRPVRRGVTLLEVLTAIFIMGIGLLALMTLFPVGALSMAQALKDDRTAQVAAQGDGLIRTQWRATVIDPVQLGVIWTEVGISAMDDPNLLERRLHTAAAPLTPPGTPGQHRLRYIPDLPVNTNTYYLPAPLTIPQPGAPGPGKPVSSTSLVLDTDEGAVATIPPSNTYDVTHRGRTNVPSFPVLIDPVGYHGRLAANAERYWVGRSASNLPVFPNIYPNFLLPRRDMLGIKTTPNPQQSALAIFSLTDDLTFEPNGAPPPSSIPNQGALLRRQGRYTWAALMQRLRNDDLLSATFKILVFDSRATLPPTGDEVMALSIGTVSEGVRQITVDIPPRSAEEPPVVRKGSWVLDGTIQNGPTGLQDPLSIRNAHFYRIVGVTEVSSGVNGTQYVLDIDPPLRRPTVAPGTTLPVPFAYTAQFYFFANLAEVFERPALRPDAENTGSN